MQELRPGLWTWTAAHPGWTDDQGGPEDLRESLRPLFDPPVQHVLVLHGKPALRGGKRALERVLQAPSAA